MEGLTYNCMISGEPVSHDPVFYSCVPAAQTSRAAMRPGLANTTPAGCEQGQTGDAGEAAAAPPGLEGRGRRGEGVVSEKYRAPSHRFASSPQGGGVP